MSIAANGASDVIEGIIQTIDPPKKQIHVFLDDVLSALSAGLAFVVVPEAAALGEGAAAIASIFLKSIQQAPGIARIIWPIGSVQRELQLGADLGEELETVVKALGPRVSQALGAVMGVNQTDVSAFLAFAGDGDFSGPRDTAPDLTKDTGSLLTAFTTFLVSQALVLDGWHVVLSIDTDPLGLTNGTFTCPPWTKPGAYLTADYIWDWSFTDIDATPCTTFPDFNFYDLDCHEYDQYNQCKDSYWWYSSEVDIAFTLAKDPYYGISQQSSQKEKDPSSILHSIFDNSWSTGRLLLENAGFCVLIAAQCPYNPDDPDCTEDFAARMMTTVDVDDLNGWYVIFLDAALRSYGHIEPQPPNGTDYTISNNGITNFDCTTQLNATVYTDWSSVYYLHKNLHT